jgi:hypothetical protein
MRNIIPWIAILTLCLNAHALRVKDEQVILDKLSDYGTCHTRKISADYCQEGLSNWVDAHPNDVFEAAKLTRQQMFPWVALPLLVRAFAANKGKCADEDVKLAVIAGLGRSENETQPIQDAKKIAFQYCEKELKTAIIQAATDDYPTRMNLCHEIQAKKWFTLTPMQLKLCK